MTSEPNIPAKMNILDIESKKIVKGMPLTPEPVGCAVRFIDGRKHYFAWGHPEGNNCTKEEFRQVLLTIWGEPILGHNSDGFDLQDLEHHFKLPPRDTALNFDTLFAAYLDNPDAKSLRLKDMAHERLGIPPDEQQELYDWIMANVPDCRSRKEAGAYISEAPVSIVGPYAIGDIDRTGELWDSLEPSVRRMWPAFERERQLAPILARANRRGIRVDAEGLQVAWEQSVEGKAKLDACIHERLHLHERINLDSNEELGEVLLAKGFEGFLLTPKARKPSMAKASLEAALAQSDPDLFAMLNSRSRYEKLLSGFIVPWRKFCDMNGGRLHPLYNQVRTPANEDGNSYGTRTGRLSCVDPNFQQVAKLKKGLKAVDYFGLKYPSLRSLLLPEDGQEWACGDIKSQEPRITAHFESGQMMMAFLNDPELDPYVYIQETCGLLDEGGRDTAKVIFLGLVYAMGVARLADALGVSEKEARDLRALIKRRLRDIVDLDNDCKRIFKMGGSLCTLGGRYYTCEHDDSGIDWSYKALNTLVQGSAGDQTKEIIIYMDRKAPPEILLCGTVHDEVNYSIPLGFRDELRALLNEAANYLPCDVPMLMDVGFGANWQEAKP